VHGLHVLGNLLPGSACEGYTSLLRPDLWLLVVVGSCWESWEMARALYAPTQAIVGSFSSDGSECFFCLVFVYSFFSQCIIAMS
jgi:hypothetical protein